MTNGSDPFIHHPELRDKVVEPLKSNYRTIDIAILDEKMRTAGASTNWRHSDAQREDSRNKTLKSRLDNDLWVFAYGSLMWDPAFRFSEIRTAQLKGYQRSFCVKSELGRGTPEKPGLMACLDAGGECRGLTFRIDRKFVEEETQVLWRREMLMHVYAAEFVVLETPFGDLEALAFVVDRSATAYLPGMSLQETAGYMATGAGIFGSSLEYLANLAGQFKAIGIEDDELFSLYDLARRLNANTDKNA